MSKGNKPSKIFLIIFDTLRKDHTGKVYGNNWIQTPNFDKFANNCLVFDKAYPESLPTIPARRSIYTGIRTVHYFSNPPQNYRTDDYVLNLGNIPGWYPIPHDQTNISEYLYSLGYDPALISSLYHQFKPNMNFHLGFWQWNWIRGHETDKFKIGLNQISMEEMKNKVDSTVIKSTKTLTEDALEIVYNRLHKLTINSYLRNTQTFDDNIPDQTFKKSIEFVKETLHNRQIFLVIEEFAPHEPWSPALKFRDLYLKDYDGNNVIEPLYQDNIDYLTSGELHCLRANYAGDVTQCDIAFGSFIDYLKQENIYDDSLIILTSDHGFSIGEHNFTGKIPMAMYPELIDIPFFIKPPSNIKGPKRITKSYVYHHDVLPTLFGFLNAEIPEIFEGIDLSIFNEEEDQLIGDRDYITIGMHAASLYKDDKWALITMNDQSDQKLFDLEKDPEWNANVASDHSDVVKECFEKIKNDVKGPLYLGGGINQVEMMKWYRIISDHKLDWED